MYSSAGGSEGLVLYCTVLYTLDTLRDAHTTPNALVGKPNPFDVRRYVRCGGCGVMRIAIPVKCGYECGYVMFLSSDGTCATEWE